MNVSLGDGKHGLKKLSKKTKEALPFPSRVNDGLCSAVARVCAPDVSAAGEINPGGVAVSAVCVCAVV